MIIGRSFILKLAICCSIGIRFPSNGDLYRGKALVPMDETAIKTSFKRVNELGKREIKSDIKEAIFFLLLAFGLVFFFFMV